jgi:hypothetical protein
MKKTNVAFFSIAAKMVRILPALLCFILLSSSDLVAQNYKSLDDAQISVKEALGDIESDVIDLTASVNAGNPDDTRNVVKLRLFNRFLDTSIELHSVANAVDRMEPYLKWQRQAEPMKTYLREASEELMDLITN